MRRLEELEEGAKAGRATPTTGTADNGVGGDSLHQEATAHRYVTIVSPVGNGGNRQLTDAATEIEDRGHSEP